MTLCLTPCMGHKKARTSHDVLSSHNPEPERCLTYAETYTQDTHHNQTFRKHGTRLNICHRPGCTRGKTVIPTLAITMFLLHSPFGMLGSLGSLALEALTRIAILQFCQDCSIFLPLPQRGPTGQRNFSMVVMIAVITTAQT